MGWRRPRPITDATAPPQCPPPRSSRFERGGDRRRSASSAPPPWDYNSRQALLQGRGPRVDRGRGPRTLETQRNPRIFPAFLWVSMGAPNTSQSPGAPTRRCPGPLEGLRDGSARTHRLPSLCRTPPQGLKQCPGFLSLGCCRTFPSLGSG